MSVDIYAAMRAKAGARGAALQPVASGPKTPTRRGEAWALGAVDNQIGRLDALRTKRWEPGDLWDTTTFEVACALVRVGNHPQTPWSAAELLEHVRRWAPRDEAWGEREVEAKIDSAIKAVGAMHDAIDLTDNPPPLPTTLLAPAPAATTPDAPGDGAPGSSWADLDLTDVVRGVQDGTLARPTPSLAHVQGGGALLYPGRVHGVHGAPGAGKTWVAAIALAERIRAREHCVLVDLEDTPPTIVERLVIDLRVPADDVLTFLHYKRPTEPLRLGLDYLHDTVREHAVTLVVIDSTGEALANDGVKPNEDHEVAVWMSAVARSTADLGPAVLLLDHVPKPDEKVLMPIGSQRKQAAMNGAIYSVQLAVPFARDKAGMAKVVCGKDRLGAYARGQVVAELRVTPVDGRSNVELAAAHDLRAGGGTFRPTVLMERISRFLEDGGPTTTNGIVESDAVLGKKRALVQALGVLVAEGYVVREAGPRNAQFHRLVKPYREASDVGGPGGAEMTAQNRPGPGPGLKGGPGTRSLPPGPGPGGDPVGPGTPDSPAPSSIEEDS